MYLRNMNNIAVIKQSVVDQIDSAQPQLKELALKIHANPELGLQEFKASSWLAQYLTEKDFAVERGICDLPTAFRASYGKGKPAIALLAEYDALPGIGHACGHNLICTIAIGAAIASKQTVDQSGGRILVIGTPAEEGYGGKIVMAHKGAFSDLDAAMMVHPDTVDIATSMALSCQHMKVEFFGKSAHASANPSDGINALDAMILSFNNINALRQHIKSTARIHGIITDGGQAANIVPAHSAAEFYVRAADDAYLDELIQKVLNCFIGAATATGARFEYTPDNLRYASMCNNMTLAQLYVDNMRIIGREVKFPQSTIPLDTGSTDMGNVSQLVPAIHPALAIAPKSVSVHSPEFATAAASDDGINGMCDAAKAIAMIVVDLLSNPETLRKVRDEFKQLK
ncbi:MAG: M20 family metallopeptidase [Chloroflexi bacterium]|nr:M20 family metallopeptidase [Chloroflexota bacterium]